MANHNFVFNNISEGLPVIAKAVMDGDEFGSRGGRTKELIATSITLRKPWQREIVLPERKANVAAQIAETMWVLAGRDNSIEWLSHYLPRAADFADDGKHWRAAYGPRLRNWNGVDQISYIVDTLRASPGSRQAVAVIWDPEVDTLPGLDRACNDVIQFTSRHGQLDMHVFIRSNDVVWGLTGINTWEWSVLQEIIAGILGIQMGSLHLHAGSLHLYDRHWEKARRLVEHRYTAMYDDSPRFNATGMDDMTSFDYCADEWFFLEQQIRTGKDVQHNVDEFPEPMLRSWLRVLQWYWTGDVSYLRPLRHTRLYAACQVGTKPPGQPAPQSALSAPAPGVLARVQEHYGETLTPRLEAAARALEPSFLGHVNALHSEKHAAYGDSWKRRGEYMIMANIARKIDRIDSGVDTSDETQGDTAVDLLVYLAKYRCWLDGGSGDPVEVDVVLKGLTGTDRPHTLVQDFSDLELASSPAQKIHIVNMMLEQAYTYALSLWR